MNKELPQETSICLTTDIGQAEHEDFLMIEQNKFTGDVANIMDTSLSMPSVASEFTAKKGQAYLNKENIPCFDPKLVK